MGAVHGRGARDRDDRGRRRVRGRGRRADRIKVGYTISPGFQGHGYATEAITALVDYAFGTLGAEIVRAHASAENAPPIRVAEKVGMRLVERVEYREGDEVWHGVRDEVRR